MGGELRHVAAQELPVWWPILRDRIAAACARSGGKYLPADILKEVAAGRMHVFAVTPLARDDASADAPPPIQAIAIAEITQFPRRRVCRVLACTGEKTSEWLDKLAEIEAWARRCGCTAIEPVARPGWERKLKSRGYRKTHVVLEKSLIAEKIT